MSNIFFETDSKCGCFTITQPCRNECICVRDARNAKINDTFVHSKCPILVTFKTDCGVIFIFYSRMYMDVVGRNIHYIRILFLLILNFNPHLIIQFLKLLWQNDINIVVWRTQKTHAKFQNCLSNFN